MRPRRLRARQGASSTRSRTARSRCSDMARSIVERTLPSARSCAFRRTHLALIAFAAAMGGQTTPLNAAESAQVAFTSVERVVAFADVHGAYDDMTRLLKAAGVVNESLRWSAGRTHLISTGDMLDRGRDRGRVRDLRWGLQGEAASAGGRVHVPLGNHEAMNLLGFWRAVGRGEIEQSAGEGRGGVGDRMRTGWSRATVPIPV